MPTILLIPEFGPFGGTRTYLLDLLDFYAESTYDVIVALTKKQADDEVTASLVKKGYRHRLIPEHPSRCFGIFRRFPLSLVIDLALVRRIIRSEKPDLIVVSNGTPGLFFGLVAYSAKLLYIMHTYPMRPSSALLRRVMRMVFTIGMTRNKRIVTCSAYAKQSIIDHFVLPSVKDLIVVIPHTAGRAIVHADDRKPSAAPVLRVLTLGHVTWYKNPDMWVQVACAVVKQLPSRSVEFIWAGEGDLAERCTAQIIPECRNAVRFIGYRKDIEELYRSSSVYYQPSLEESYGLAVADAMRRGIPCVVSDAGGLPETVQDGVTGFVVPARDAHAMVQKILLLLGDETMRRRMGEAATRRYDDFFSPSLWKKRVRNLHETILAQQ